MRERERLFCLNPKSIIPKCKEEYTNVNLWAGAGPPGGTVRRAAVRKRGPAPLVSVSTNFPNDYG